MAEKIDYRTALGRIIKEMKDDCKRLVMRAQSTKDYTNRSFHLRDSYGAAVYHNGVLLTDTIYYREPVATGTKNFKRDGSLVSTSGHRAMIDYLHRYKPRKKGLTIVLVAAMPYGEILESGRGLQRKYKVIIGSNSLMRELAAKYDGMFGRRRGSRTTVSVEID